MENTTESNSRYDHLEQVGTTQVLQYINQEDTLVPQIVMDAFRVFLLWWMRLFPE